MAEHSERGREEEEVRAGGDRGRCFRASWLEGKAGFYLEAGGSPGGL